MWHLRCRDVASRCLTGLTLAAVGLALILVIAPGRSRAASSPEAVTMWDRR